MSVTIPTPEELTAKTAVIASQDVESLKQLLGDQADVVRAIKADDTLAGQLPGNLTYLKALKEKLNALIEEAQAESKASAALRADLEDVLIRRFFYAPSFEIYGGVGGLYDYGPSGCAVEADLLKYWRQHFVLSESMHQIRATCLTPHVVLKTSGHVDRFCDFMVRDSKTSECLRADHLLEKFIDNLLEDASNPVSDAKREVRVQRDVGCGVWRVACGEQ